MLNRLLEYDDFTDIADGMNSLMKKILGPVLVVIGVLAVIYAIYLGVLYAKAEDGTKRKEVQGRLIGALIGAVIIIVGMTLCFTIKWDKVFENFAQEDLDGNGIGANIANLVRMMIR